MPPEVARWAVAPFAVEGGVMLDPFAGSTVLCEAAEDAGMRAVGFDLNPGKPPALTYGDPAPGTLFNLFGEAS
jgi:DNA modification methylase